MSDIYKMARSVLVQKRKSGKEANDAWDAIKKKYISQISRPGAVKNNRDAFLYFDSSPKSPPSEFSQCSTCRMFVPDEYLGRKDDIDLCVIHGSNVKVGESFSCGLYCGWPKGPPVPEVIRDHAAELKKGIPGSVTPDESGLVDRKVRCENCVFHLKYPSTCHLYDMLNKAMPEYWDLDINVDPKGCCNANMALTK